MGGCLEVRQFAGDLGRDVIAERFLKKHPETGEKEVYWLVGGWCSS